MRAQSLSVRGASGQSGRETAVACPMQPAKFCSNDVPHEVLSTNYNVDNKGAWYVTFISTCAFSKMHEGGPGKLLLFKWDLKSLCDEYGDYILHECNVV